MLIVTDYGKDIRIGKVVSTQDGLDNLITALVRRLSTATGSLFYDLEYGLDLRIFLNTEITPSTLDLIRVQVENQLELDKRVESVRCDISFNPQAFQLDLNIQVVPIIDEEFTLVLSVDKVTVELLDSSLNE